MTDKAVISSSEEGKTIISPFDTTKPPCMHNYILERTFEHKYWKDDMIPGYIDTFRQYGIRTTGTCEKCGDKQLKLGWKQIGPTERLELTGEWWNMSLYRR